MRYIINKNVQICTDYHKIHKESCKRRPKEENAIDLGECMCPIDAKSRAKEYFENVNGCKYCCREIFFKENIRLNKNPKKMKFIKRKKSK